MKVRKKSVIIFLSLLIGSLAIVGNSLSKKPVPTIMQEKTKMVIPPPLEEVPEPILPSPVDSVSRSQGEEIDEAILPSPDFPLSERARVESKGLTDDHIKPVEIRTRKAHQHRPADMKFEDPSKTNKKRKEQK